MAETAINSIKQRFMGFIDDFSSKCLHGWVVDQLDIDYNACLVVFAGDLIVGTCKADVVRSDLISLMPGEGRHGFSLELRDEYLNADRVEVYAVTREVFDAVIRPEVSKDDGHPLHGRATFVQIFADLVGRIDGFNEASPSLVEVMGSISGSDREGGIGILGVILVDVQDLLAFHRVHLRVTGIQRVLCGLISTLSAAGQLDEVEFCHLGTRPGTVRIVQKALLCRFISTLLRDDATLPDLNGQIDRLEQSAQPHRTRAIDTFFLAGAYWISDQLDRHVTLMRQRGTRVGLYIYDLIPLTHPDLTAATTRRQFVERAVEPLSLSDFIFTISRFVANQTEALLLNETGRTPPIRVVPLPHQLMTVEQTKVVRTPTQQSDNYLQERAPFVLCVCTIEGRKNHMLLYRIWAGLIRKHGRASIPKLVLVGRWGWNVNEVRNALETSGYLDGMVTVRSDVTDSALASLYADCLLTVFPSFAEGWGLPVGESLAAGKVCVASRATAVPEVGGTFCDYFDPHDYLDAFAVIEHAIFDSRWRIDRERYIASNFRSRSWIDTAADFLEGLQSAHAEPRTGARGTTKFYASKDVIDFVAIALHDERISWSLRSAKFALTMGWHTADASGFWASARKAEIVLPSVLPSGTRVILVLRLASPDRTQSCLLRVGTDEQRMISVVVAATPNWHEVETTVGLDGVIRLTLIHSADTSGQILDRRGNYALSAMGLFTPTVAGDQAATYRKMLELSFPRNGSYDAEHIDG